MNKLLILASILVYPFLHLNAQGTIFPTENAKWCYSEYYDDGSNAGNTCFEYDDEKYEINGIEYAQLTADYGFSELEKFYIREQNGQVFLFDEVTNEEYLLYDFNLEVGDSFTTGWGFPLYNEEITIEVQSIESVTLSNGEERRMFVLSSDKNHYSIQWIEGIGDYIWLFFSPGYTASLSGGFTLQCFIQNGTVIFSRSNGYCQAVGTKELAQDIQISIKPNPANEQVLISSNDYQILEVEILNNFAQILDTKALGRNINNIEFDISDYIPGMYFVKSKLSTGTIKTNQFIIN